MQKQVNNNHIHTYRNLYSNKFAIHVFIKDNEINPEQEKYADEDLWLVFDTYTDMLVEWNRLAHPEYQNVFTMTSYVPIMFYVIKIISLFGQEKAIKILEELKAKDPQCHLGLTYQQSH